LGPLWIFYAPKARRIVRLRGDIVYYAWVLLEGDPEVVELCEQPFSVRIKVDRRWRSALVDIWARLRDGRQLFIFPVYRNQVVGAKSGRAMQRMRVLTAWAELTGTALAVMPDTAIWRDPQFLSNWAHILRFLGGCHRAADIELADFVLRAVTARRRMPLGEIESSISHAEPTAVRAAVFRLLHAGALHADLREHRLGAQTVFTCA
jgi:hypothetical protein